jgi:RimJ/RimL family protein N-acetyltransferase
MENEKIVALICTPETFTPVGHEEVRWLDQDEDLGLYQQSSRDRQADPLSPEGSVGVPERSDWEEWHDQGYRYCALIQDGMILARAASWTYSETAWELAAVWTHEDHRGRGYAKAVCSFVTAHILAGPGRATCHTSNPAMIRVAESLGYQRAG